MLLFDFLFDILHKGLGGFERRNVVGGDDDGSVLADIAPSLFGTFFHDEATEAAEVDILTLSEAVLHYGHKFFHCGLNGDFLDTSLLSYFSYNFCLCHFSLLFMR